MTAEGFPADWVIPDWPAPANVAAVCTTRAGGVSRERWATMNLGLRCGDDAAHVQRNRRLLNELLPGEPLWLRQVHGTEVADFSAGPGGEPAADAVISRHPNQVCAVLSADCLPVLLCDRAGTRVGAAHAGWRGLAGGVLEAAIEALGVAPAEIMAWLGPAIGPGAYEVGGELVEAFAAEFPLGFEKRGDRWLLDLYAIARLRLRSAGVDSIYGGGFCTFSDEERFFSYRRDGETGRMASLIWMT